MPNQKLQELYEYFINNPDFASDAPDRKDQAWDEAKRRYRQQVNNNKALSMANDMENMGKQYMDKDLDAEVSDPNLWRTATGICNRRGHKHYHKGTSGYKCRSEMVWALSNPEEAAEWQKKQGRKEEKKSFDKPSKIQELLKFLS